MFFPLSTFDIFLWENEVFWVALFSNFKWYMLFESQHVTKMHHGKNSPLKSFTLCKETQTCFHTQLWLHWPLRITPFSSAGETTSSIKTWLHPRRIYNDPARKAALSLIIRAVERLWGQLLYVKGVFSCMQQLELSPQSQIRPVSFSISTNLLFKQLKCALLLSTAVVLVVLV